MGIGIWWTSQLSSRVDALEKHAQVCDITHTTVTADQLLLKDRVLKLEMTIANIDYKLNEIKDIISKKK